MLYYLALTWNPDSTDQTAFATRKKQELLNRKDPTWQVAIDTKGMVVLYHIVGENILYDIHCLPDNKGVIIGKLFKRSYINAHSAEHMPDPVIFDRTLTDQVISSGGRVLINDFWGGYIAFLMNPSSKERWVLRDPTGELPCQHSHLEGVDVYFVRLEDFDQLKPPKLTLNQHFLAGYLVFRTLCRRETGLEEIETILPGECALHKGLSRSILTYWNAMDVSQVAPIYDFEEAVEQARHALRSCVHAWASCFDGVALSLSGGLDSSIVLTCLKDAPNQPKILSRNYFSAEAPNADERDYARAVAEKCGSKIIHISTGEDLDEKFDSARIRSMYPSGWPIDMDEHLERDQELRKDGYSSEFYGHGGDELFCKNSNVPLSADQAWTFGWSKEFLKIISSDAKLRSSSYWKILRLAHYYGLRKNKWHVKHVYRNSIPPLINPDTYESALNDSSHWHPLYQETGNLPPAKFEHCFSLTYGLASAHVGMSTPYPLPARSPLKSQPLLELCLSVFMPLHQNGGIDRAIARHAFMPDLPEKISLRSTKAHGTQKYTNLLEMKINEVRAHLINGALMEMDLLNNEALIQCLQSKPSTVQAETLHICQLMSMETWVRRFQ